MQKRFSLLAATVASAAMLLSGCSGDNGAAGPQGPAGPAGPVTLTDESCVVCHSNADEADQVAMHAKVYDATTGTRFLKDRFAETALAISNVTVTSNASNHPVITFTVKNGSTVLPALSAADVNAYVADIVPAGTAAHPGGAGTTTYTYNSPYPQIWNFGNNTSGTTPFASFSYNANTGVCSIELATPFGGVAPDTVTTRGTTKYSNIDFNIGHNQRLMLRVAPTTTNLGTSVVNVANGVAIKDFTVGGAAGAYTITPVADIQNQITTIDACIKCHSTALAAMAHGNSYRDVTACIVCHSPISASGAPSLTSFMHEIHAAKNVAEFPTRIFGNGYTDVTYPRPLTDCTACHGNPNPLKVLGTGDKLNNWKANPSIEACGSCHDNVNFTTGANHLGGVKTNAQCVLCHDAADTASRHTPAVAAKDTPEYDATMTISAPANGTHYVAGETPTVTVTLKDHTTGAAVPAALYTNAKHAAGSTVADSLSKASLYVYGPRANAVPVFTTASNTLTAAGAKTQAQPLFVGTAFNGVTDANVLTDSTGFKYKLTIPTGVTSGTYMVRFIAQNYGYKSDTDYKIDSTKFANIQVGTATVEPKISGSTCVDCHGNGNFTGHNARHSVVFNTDECISCHDKSGNHANPLDNRIHAIHSASKTGDKLYDPVTEPGLDWSGVTYPQGLRSKNGATPVTAGAPRCAGCHTGTTGTGVQWKTSISQSSCIGCHADKPGAKDHFLQNGGK